MRSVSILHADIHLSCMRPLYISERTTNTYIGCFKNDYIMYKFTYKCMIIYNNIHVHKFYFRN